MKELEAIWLVIIIGIILVCIAGWIYAAWYFCLFPTKTRGIGELEWDHGHKRGKFIGKKKMASETIKKLETEFEFMNKLVETLNSDGVE